MDPLASGDSAALHLVVRRLLRLAALRLRSEEFKELEIVVLRRATLPLAATAAACPDDPDGFTYPTRR